MTHGTGGSGARLRTMVKLMLVSLVVMLAAIVALYIAPLGVAPLVAASLYASLWGYERRLGVASPITRFMTVFNLLLACAVHLDGEASWMGWLSPAVYWTLAAVILALLAAGRPFTAIYTGDAGFRPLHLVQSMIWGITHFVAGLAALLLIPNPLFLYVPLCLMVLGVLATVWLNFCSMGPACGRRAQFDLGGYSFREARSRSDCEAFHKMIAEAYRSDLQSALGMRRRIDTAMIIREHRAANGRWGDDLLPFLAFAGDRPVGGICIFFDHRHHGLPIEGEARIDVNPWRRAGPVAEVGRLGVLRRHRLSPLLLKGLFKCVVEAAAEKGIHFIFNDSFEFQAKMYEKLGFRALSGAQYVSHSEGSTGYGLEVLPMMMNLAAIVRMDTPSDIAAEMEGVLAPYVMERFFKRLVVRDAARAVFHPIRNPKRYDHANA